MGLRRPPAALMGTLALLAPAPATAQIGAAALVGPLDRRAEVAVDGRLPSFLPPAGDLRTAGEPRRSGLIAAWPVDERLTIGVGRFTVPELARPRTHMENDRQPTAIRPRDRGMAALGFSLRF